MDAVLYDKRYVLEGLLNSIGLVVECMRIDLAVLSHSPPSDSSSNAGGKNPKPLPSTPKPKPQACGRQKNPQARNLRTLPQEAAEATVRSVELSKTQLSTPVLPLSRSSQRSIGALLHEGFRQRVPAAARCGLL